MTRTSKRLAARTAARQRQAKANEDQHHREHIELEYATEFEVARMRRNDAAATAVTHEIAMAHQVRTLLTLGNSVTRVAELTGEPESEIKRLRKLADDASQDGRAGTGGPPEDGLRNMAGRRPRRNRTTPVDTATQSTGAVAERFASTYVSTVPSAASRDPHRSIATRPSSVGEQ